MKIRFCLVAATICLSAAFVRAEEQADPDSTLRKTTTFAMGGVGVVGSMAAGERALRDILNQPNATARLEKMIPDASPAAQLYALVGLRDRDRAAFQRALEKVRGNTAAVPTLRGCIMQTEKFGDLVQQIEEGKFDSYLSRKWPEQRR